ncbi:MAG: hypothetical protein JEZ07_17705 [Phycisphaerae bacterium]|nr:hypothetical protein [Phycisphaerae bacterium]
MKIRWVLILILILSTISVYILYEKDCRYEAAIEYASPYESLGKAEGFVQYKFNSKCLCVNIEDKNVVTYFTASINWNHDLGGIKFGINFKWEDGVLYVVDKYEKDLDVEFANYAMKRIDNKSYYIYLMNGDASSCNHWERLAVTITNP